MSVRRIPPSYFASAFGLSGLTEVWRIAAGQHRAPVAVATALSAVSGLVFVGVLAAYLAYAATHRDVVKQDLFHPVTGPFLSLVTIVPMFLSLLGVYPYAPVAGKAMFEVFLVLTVLLGSWFVGHWIVAGIDAAHVHPGYFLPTVAGGLIGADGAALVGEHRLAEVMFGYGLISWIVLGSIVLGRLISHPIPPTLLIPTLAIQTAPPAVATLAWLDDHPGHIDAFVSGLGGYGALMILVQVRLLPDYLRLPFMPSTWAFAFSGSVCAAAGLYWLDAERPAGFEAEEYLVIGAITLLVASIAVRTLIEPLREMQDADGDGGGPVALVDEAAALAFPEDLPVLASAAAAPDSDA